MLAMTTTTPPTNIPLPAGAVRVEDWGASARQAQTACRTSGADSPERRGSSTAPNGTVTSRLRHPVFNT